MRRKSFKIAQIILLVITIGFFAIYNSNANELNSDTVDVSHYEIHLDITNFSGHVLSGNTILFLSPKIENITYIPVELWGLTVDSVFYNSELLPTVFQYDGMNLRIPVSGQLLLTDTVSVNVFYHGVPHVDPSGWGGFNFEAAEAYNLGVGFGADPHNLGKAWFPCVDDFIDRATYSYFITTETGKTAVCSGVFIESFPDPSNPLRIIHHWELNEEIPTYLASVAVGNFVAIRDTFQGIQNLIPADIYVLPAYQNYVSGSFVNLQGAFDAFEYRFGEYKWPRVGYVGTSVGAMEHQCNIAYPNFLINGNTNYESTMAHELSHSWFGNLITAASSGDMWINEGWASFGEFIFMEEVYGKEAAKNYIRKQHADNLRLLQHNDGWISLAGVTHEYTYSNTVYDKGAGVAHSLRGYLGDSIFFTSVKLLLQEYAYQPVSIEQFRDFLTQNVPGNLNGFFDAYIYSPGWNQFSIDSFITQYISPGEYEVNVSVRQKLKEMPSFADDNRLNVTFISHDWQQTTRQIFFDGETGSQTFIVDFEPEIAILNMDEEFLDATTDYKTVINSAGSFSYDNAYFKLQIDDMSDSAFMRIEHNWVSPDGFKSEHPEYVLSDSRYWKIDGIFPEIFTGQFKFYYNNKTNGDGWLDDTWFPYPMSADSLVILFRKAVSEEWEELPSEIIGNSRSGWLATDSMKTGEYALAWRDRTLGMGIIRDNDNSAIKTYPNPVSDMLTIEYDVEKKADIRIFNSQGKIVFSKRIKPDEKILHINTSGLAIGVYVIDIETVNFISNTRFVVSR